MRAWREHRALESGVAMLHRYPAKDGRQHQASPGCWCKPQVDARLCPGAEGVQVVTIAHRPELLTLRVPDALPEDLGGGSL